MKKLLEIKGFELAAHMYGVRWYRNDKGEVILQTPYIGEDGEVHWYWWD